MNPILEIEALLALHRPYHSAFQIDRLILAEHGITPYGVLKQCLRELDSRWSSLKRRYLDREAKRAFSRCIDDGEELGAETIVEHRTEVRALDLSWRDCAREFLRFWEIARILHAELLADGPLDAERVEALDAAEWEQQCVRRAALDVLATGRVSRDTMQFACSFPATPDSDGGVSARGRILCTISGMMQQAIAGQEPTRAQAIAMREHAVPRVPISEPDVRAVEALVESAVSELALVSREVPMLGVDRPAAPLASMEAPT